jgi:hypothetical protein
MNRRGFFGIAVVAAAVAVGVKPIKRDRKVTPRWSRDTDEIKSYAIEFFAYETPGGTIGHTSNLARAAFS